MRRYQPPSPPNDDNNADEFCVLCVRLLCGVQVDTKCHGSLVPVQFVLDRLIFPRHCHNLVANFLPRIQCYYVTFGKFFFCRPFSRTRSDRPFGKFELIRLAEFEFEISQDADRYCTYCYTNMFTRNEQWLVIQRITQKAKHVFHQNCYK